MIPFTTVDMMCTQSYPFLVDIAQLGLQVHVGHDVSTVKDDVNAVKEGMNFSKVITQARSPSERRMCYTHGRWGALWRLHVK